MLATVITNDMTRDIPSAMSAENSRLCRVLTSPLRFHSRPPGAELSFCRLYLGQETQPVRV